MPAGKGTWYSHLLAPSFAGKFHRKLRGASVQVEHRSGHYSEASRDFVAWAERSGFGLNRMRNAGPGAGAVAVGIFAAEGIGSAHRC